MTPEPDPTRPDKTAAWQGVEDDAHCTPQGSGSRESPPSQVLRALFLHREGKGVRQPQAASSVLTWWGQGLSNPGEADLQCPPEEGRY